MKENSENNNDCDALVFDLPVDDVSARDAPTCDVCTCRGTLNITGTGAAYVTQVSQEDGCNYRQTPCHPPPECNRFYWSVYCEYDHTRAVLVRGPIIWVDDGSFKVEQRCECKDETVDVELRRTSEFIYVSSNGGGDVSISGTPGDDCNCCYAVDSDVILTATPYDCYEFDHWEYQGGSDPHGIDGSTSASVTIKALPLYKPSENSAWTERLSSYYAVFKKIKYRLVAKPNIAEASNLNIDEEVDCGSTREISAYPKNRCDYRFVKWSDGVTDSSRTVTMDGDKTFTAIFERVTYSLTVTNDTGHGTYTLSKAGPYHNGDVVYVYAHPDSCYSTYYPTQRVEFSCYDERVTVSFYKSYYTLTISKTGSGTILVNGSTSTSSSWSFECGDTVTIVARPASCWKFSNWSGSASGTSKTINITMNGNKSVNAVFTACKEDNRIIHCKGDVIFDTYSGNPMYQQCDCS